VGTEREIKKDDHREQRESSDASNAASTMTSTAALGEAQRHTHRDTRTRRVAEEPLIRGA
jgi:hypothetical protein